MTSNQLTFWRDQEQARSNRAREIETQRSNLAKEMETQRHDVQDEAVRFAQVFENQRHNQQMETLERVNLDLKQQDLNYEGQRVAIANAQALTNLNELYAKYGAFAAESIPWDVRSKVLNDLGVEVNEEIRAHSDESTVFNQFWGEFRTFWKNFTSGIANAAKAVTSLF